MAQRKHVQRDKKIRQPKDAIALLKADHQRVRALFQEYETSQARRDKLVIADKVFVELELHAQVEEEVFYPAFEEETNRIGQELIEESLKEHDEIVALIKELRTLEPGTEEFERKFHALRLKAEHHVQEEESQILPQAEEKLEEQLKDIGDEMQEVKEQLLAP